MESIFISHSIQRKITWATIRPNNISDESDFGILYDFSSDETFNASKATCRLYYCSGTVVLKSPENDRGTGTSAKWT